MKGMFDTMIDNPDATPLTALNTVLAKAKGAEVFRPWVNFRPIGKDKKANNLPTMAVGKASRPEKIPVNGIITQADGMNGPRERKVIIPRDIHRMTGAIPHGVGTLREHMNQLGRNGTNTMTIGVGERDLSLTRKPLHMAGKAIMSHDHHKLGVNELWRVMMSMDAHCKDQSPAPALVDNLSGRCNPSSMTNGDLVVRGKLRADLHQYLRLHHQYLVLLLLFLLLGEAHLVPSAAPPFTADRHARRRRQHVTDRNGWRYLTERIRRRDHED